MQGHSNAGNTPPGPPPAVVLMQLASSRWLAHSLGTLAGLRVPDHLANGPQTPEEVAPKVGAHGPTLRRLMRALATVGVFVEDAEGRFANTPLSDALKTGPNTMRAWVAMSAHPAMLRAWENLSFSVATGRSAFEHEHGESLFEYMREDAELAALFDDAMTGLSAQGARAVVDAFDFAGIEQLVDVGGGAGMLLACVLSKAPSTKGVLFDLRDVVARSREVLEGAGVSGRCDVVEGNFFQSVPEGADAYMMKSILHDWDDERCLAILRNVHKAARRNARLLVIEMVVPPGNGPHPSKLLDLQMLVVTSGGRERTADEWKRLLADAGFSLARVVPTSGPQCVIEARRLDAP